MKTSFLIVLISLLVITRLCGQTNEINTAKYQFAKDVFAKYEKKIYERFAGKIYVESKNLIQYDGKILTIPDISDAYRLIFSEGILCPDIITGNKGGLLERNTTVNLKTKNESSYDNMTGTDSVWIGNFSELEEINPGYKIKRFVFWLSNPGMMNLTECYFELENNKAVKETPLNEFIKNARLTFYYRGTIII
jgi:hypothetical protein